jgi:hypothetical protein
MLLGSEGFESTLYLEETFILHVVSNTLEEHVWPTRSGQIVCAEGVVYDSLWEGRTRSCFFLVGEEEKNWVRFEDLPVDTITSLRSEENALVVSLGRKADVKCVDAENSRLLIEIGIGGLVRLFNVKVSSRNGMFVTSKSGVRKVERETVLEAPPSPPRPLQPRERPDKWHCITCNFVNYPGSSVCRGCHLQRKQGPLNGNAWNFRFDSVPRRQFKRLPQWQCVQCGLRDNYYFAQNDSCARCGAKRKEEQKQQKKRIKK